jgi:hypothetical protein
MRRAGNHLLTPQELMDMYDQVERGAGSGGEEEHSGESTGLLSRSDSSGGGAQKPMRRYIAITVVEIVFVMAESSFWQVRRTALRISGCMFV